MPATANEYLNRLMACFADGEIFLTQKLKESLVSSAKLARSRKCYVFDDALMCGLIEARSAVIPVLDNAGVDIKSYLKRLKVDLSGYDINQVNSFASECDELLDTGERDGLQPYRILRLAQVMAQYRHSKVIDTSLFLQAMFRQSLFENLHFDENELEAIAKQPLNQQILNVLKAYESHNAFEIADSLENTVEILSDHDAYLGRIFENLTPYVRDVNSLSRIEDTVLSMPQVSVEFL